MRLTLGCQRPRVAGSTCFRDGALNKQINTRTRGNARPFPAPSLFLDVGFKAERAGPVDSAMSDSAAAVSALITSVGHLYVHIYHLEEERTNLHNWA